MKYRPLFWKIKLSFLFLWAQGPDMISNITAMAINSYAIEVSEWNAIKVDACAITYDVCMCVTSSMCTSAALNEGNVFIYCKYDQPHGISISSISLLSHLLAECEFIFFTHLEDHVLFKVRFYSFLGWLRKRNIQYLCALKECRINRVLDCRKKQNLVPFQILCWWPLKITVLELRLSSLPSKCLWSYFYCLLVMAGCMSD